MTTPLPLRQAYVPPPSGKPPRKIVVVLHGRGDSPAGFDWLPGALRQPDAGYLLLQAPDPYGGGFSWYDLPPNQGPGVLRSRAAIAGVLDGLVKQGVAAHDLILFGFSQGCLMAVDVGLRYPHALGGVCGISGYVMWPERAETEGTAWARQIPWLITAGTADPVIPFGDTQRDAAILQAAGIPVVFRGYEKVHTIDPVDELTDLRAWIAARMAE